MQSKKEIKLLWTGGWDSTFQLLRLLLIDRAPVQPYYLIDVNRRSTVYELKAMQKIKEKLFDQYPDIKPLLKTTQYYGVQDINPDSEIENAFEELKKYLGSQHNWLARFCKQHEITDMQLSVEKSRNVTENDFFTKLYLKEGNLDSLRDHAVLKYFSYPLITLDKVEMAEISNKEGWDEIMALTWFCHRPTRKKKPCGTCKPCSVAMHEGHSYRIPLMGKMNYYIHKLLIWPIKSFRKNKRK